MAITQKERDALVKARSNDEMLKFVSGAYKIIEGKITESSLEGLNEGSNSAKVALKITEKSINGGKAVEFAPFVATFNNCQRLNVIQVMEQVKSYEKGSGNFENSQNLEQCFKMPIAVKNSTGKVSKGCGDTITKFLNDHLAVRDVATKNITVATNVTTVDGAAKIVNVTTVDGAAKFANVTTVDGAAKFANVTTLDGVAKFVNNTSSDKDVVQAIQNFAKYFNYAYYMTKTSGINLKSLEQYKVSNAQQEIFNSISENIAGVIALEELYVKNDGVTNFNDICKTNSMCDLNTVGTEEGYDLVQKFFSTENLNLDVLFHIGGVVDWDIVQ
jgi:hypothetical protein